MSEAACLIFVPDVSLWSSYDAAEDNEISFREGYRITEIEPASEEWWQGKNPSGEVGLFPGVSCCMYLTYIS